MRIDERELFKSVMIGFMTDKDPMLAMLKWITQQLMQIIPPQNVKTTFSKI